MSDFFYGLKIPAGQCSAKCIQVCRKHTDLAMGEIRRRSDAGEYIIVLAAIEDGSERKMLTFKKALAKVGVTAEIYEDDKPVSDEFLRNVQGSKRDTAKYVAWEIEAELGEPVPENWEDFEYEEEDEF